jgi:transposase-like protein
MGKSKAGAQRCRCRSCGKTFQLDYTYKASKPGVKEQILQMAINGSGVADTVRVLKVGKSTVLRTIKKKPKRASG